MQQTCQWSVSLATVLMIEIWGKENDHFEDIVHMGKFVCLKDN